MNAPSLARSCLSGGPARAIIACRTKVLWATSVGPSTNGTFGRVDNCPLFDVAPESPPQNLGVTAVVVDFLTQGVRRNIGGRPDADKAAGLRGRANRRPSAVPPVSPVDEFGGQQQRDCECHLREPMRGRAVGAPSQLAKVREPRVGPLDWPSWPDRCVDWWSLSPPFVVPSLACADHVVEPECMTRGPDPCAVVATVEVERLDVDEQASFRRRVQCRGEKDVVVAVGTVGRPADRNARSVRQDRPLPAQFPRSAGFLPVPSPPPGALCWEPSRAASVRSNPMILS